jgi:putative aminopeptidase FrvX
MELLEKTMNRLCALDGPTGRESQVTAAAQELLRPLTDETWIDRMGNLLGVRRCGRADAPQVLLDAHLDEVCLTVTGTQEGMLRFRAAFGGVDSRILPGTTVRVLSDPPHDGVITCLPPHILSAEEQEKPFEMDMLRIDLGMTEEQARTIPVGTSVVYTTKPTRLGANRFCGKALDDRSCFAILLRTLERLTTPLPFDLYLLGSVQEESTMAGAKTGVFSVAPDLMVAVDVTFGASPDTPKEEAFPLGGGPAIGVGPMLRRDWSDLLQRCATREKIPFHLEVLERGLGTNAMAAAVTREGIPAAMVSLPLRYMHTPQEVIDLQDAEWSAQLLASFLQSIREEVLR